MADMIDTWYVYCVVIGTYHYRVFVEVCLRCGLLQHLACGSVELLVNQIWMSVEVLGWIELALCKTEQKCDTVQMLA